MSSRSAGLTTAIRVAVAIVCVTGSLGSAKAQLFSGWSGGGAAKVQSRPLRMRSSPAVSGMRYSPGFRAFGRWRAYSWSNSYQSRSDDDGWTGSYRTLCVRLCDGYFFPISYRASRSRMYRDAKICEASCDCEARLFYLPSSSGDVKSATDMTGQTYGRLEHAFEYKRTYDASCSCRPAAWTVPEQLRHEQYALEEAEHRVAAREGKGRAMVELLEREDAKDADVASALIARFEARAQKLLTDAERRPRLPVIADEADADAAANPEPASTELAAGGEPSAEPPGVAASAGAARGDTGPPPAVMAAPAAAQDVVATASAPAGTAEADRAADSEVAQEVERVTSRRAPAVKKVSGKRSGSARPSSSKAMGSKSRGFWQM